MSRHWPKVRLGDILNERRELPDAEELALGNIRIISKIGFSEGKIELRSDTNTKTGMILVRPGDLVISGINAAKGAIAIYGVNNNDPVAATIHYGAYEAHADRADITYLWWYLRSGVFRDVLLEAVPGGIKTELKASRLLPIEIPLPTLAEQRRIVARIEELAAQVHQARALHCDTTTAANALVGSALRRLALRTSVTGKLGDVLRTPPRNGWSARCDNAADGVPVLALSAVTGFRYQRVQFKRTSLHAPEDGHFWLRPGDLLITRSNTPDLVGHAAIYDGNPAPCIYPDLMMRLEIEENVTDRRFLWFWLQSPVVREFITRNAKGTSPTMKKISQTTVMAIPFPSSLPLTEQRRIVAKLDALQADVDTLKHHQRDTATELDALLPAILDRAFRGELYTCSPMS